MSHSKKTSRVKGKEPVSCIGKNIAMDQDSSDHFSHGLTDTVSIAVGSSPRYYVDCRGSSSKNELKQFSYTGLLNDVNNHAKPNNLSCNQSPCSDSHIKSTASHGHQRKNIAMDQDSSDHFTHGLIDTVSITVGSSPRYYVDCCGSSSKNELKQYKYTMHVGRVQRQVHVLIGM